MFGAVLVYSIHKNTSGQLEERSSSSVHYLTPLFSVLNIYFSPWTLRGSYKGIETMAAAAAAKSLQSCPTLWDPIDSSPPGSPVPGILQARTLEWVAISFSNAWKVKVKSFSCIRLLATPWTAAYQAPPSMGFSRQEYWVGCHCLLQKWTLPLNKILSYSTVLLEASQVAQW